MPTRIRHPDLDAPSFDYPAGGVEQLHAHHHDALLLYAVDTPFRVVTKDAVWSLLPARAMWVPIGHESGIVANRRKALRLQSLHLPAPLPANLPETPVAVAVRPFMGALIEESHAITGEDRARRRAMRALMLAEIASAAVFSEPMLRYPSSPGLRRVAAAQLDDLGDHFDIVRCSVLASMSARSFQRHFKTETGGMTWPDWVRHARLSFGRQLIDQGATVLAAALEVGYQSPSAFTAAYRKAYGGTPREARRPAPVPEPSVRALPLKRG